ncbi:MAG: hypothetical protein JO038_01765 [Alphaproteobacteria bacterium]|nr:hypothetical protein [Alphaproteobacteria bacterium]
MPPPQNMRELVEYVIGAWSRLSELAEFAQARHGYENSDVGYGAIYPADLQPDDEPMPEGSIILYGGFGEYFEFCISETSYLDILAEVFRRNGLQSAAEEMIELSRRLASGSDGSA